MSGRLAGRRILVLARLSGDGQIDNYSEQEQIDALVRLVQAEGGTPLPLYENVADDRRTRPRAGGRGRPRASAGPTTSVCPVMSTRRTRERSCAGCRQSGQ